MLGRDAGAIIVDHDRDEVLLAPLLISHVFAVPLGVGDKIRHAPFHRPGPHAAC